MGKEDVIYKLKIPKQKKKNPGPLKHNAKLEIENNFDQENQDQLKEKTNDFPVSQHHI